MPSILTLDEAQTSFMERAYPSLLQLLDQSPYNYLRADFGSFRLSTINERHGVIIVTIDMQTAWVIFAITEGSCMVHKARGPQELQPGLVEEFIVAWEALPPDGRAAIFLPWNPLVY